MGISLSPFRLLLIVGAVAGAARSERIQLKSAWSLQSSCDVKGAGTEISTLGFKTEGWHRTDLPSTVVASLVADKTYPEPYFGMNLRSLPGMNYPIGKMLS